MHKSGILIKQLRVASSASRLDCGNRRGGISGESAWSPTMDGEALFLSNCPNLIEAESRYTLERMTY